MVSLRVIRPDERRSLSTTERSAIIRAELKRRGITSRQVSVRTDNYSMGSSIRIIIRDLRVKKPDVEEIAQHHESYRRDESGDILSGGNRFVFVEYDHDAIRDAAAPIANFLTDALDHKRDVALDHGFRVWREGSGPGKLHLAQFDETQPYPRCAVKSCPSMWDVEAVADRYIRFLAAEGLF